MLDDAAQELLPVAPRRFGLAAPSSVSWRVSLRAPALPPTAARGAGSVSRMLTVLRGGSVFLRSCCKDALCPLSRWRGGGVVPRAFCAAAGAGG
eukprot:3670496-Pyramimonas_sp.AAC.1